MKPRPILIIGPPRSGTTLLATMINAHPRIFVANEAKVLTSLLPGSTVFDASLSRETVAAILRDLEDNELASYAPLPDAAAVLQAAERPSIPAVIGALFETLAAREGKPRWGEKTAVAYRRLDAIRAAFPDALLIGMDRDPMQIAASYQKTIPKWGAFGGLINWLDYHRAIARQDAAFRMHVVSYAQLTSAPEEALRRVCAFIGEEFDTAMLEFHSTGRAASLQGKPEFAGVSRRLFTPVPPDPRLARGFRGRLGKMLIAAARSPKQPPGIQERALRGCLFVRAALWEAVQPQFRSRLLRRLRRWRLDAATGGAGLVP
jgi:hypothetical protein